MIRNIFLKIWIVCLFLLIACEDDNKPMPSYREDLVELRTDAGGYARAMYMDDGRVLNLSSPLSGLTADSIYRIRALYVVEEHYAQLYSTQVVLSSFPVTIDEVDVVKDDPVVLRSAWISKRYINFLVGVETGGQKQALAFLCHGIELTSSGAKKLKLQLYHSQMDDPQYYTRNLYLSCPIYGFEKDLTRGKDSVEMVINTYHGVQRKTYLWE